MEVWDEDNKNICISYAVIPVLDFLKGKPYDDYAKAYIYGLRPSSVRVSTGCIKCDARVDRVTVYVQDFNGLLCIDRIEQEISVAFPFVMDGGQLMSLRPTGRND